MYPLFLEFLGTSELLVILVAALVLFGPRRLPELSRSLGKSLAQFKSASEDFKRTWEQEVSVDQSRQEAQIEQAMLPADDSNIKAGEARNEAVLSTAAPAEPIIARSSSNDYSAPYTPSVTESSFSTSTEISEASTVGVAIPTPTTMDTGSDVSSGAAAAAANTAATMNDTDASSFAPSRKRDWL